MDPDTLALPAIADCIVLHDADYASRRNAFDGWITNPEDEEWPSDVRREALILVADPALTSLLKAPDFVTGKVLDLHPEPWIVTVDAKGPASVSGGGGGLYMGFTRSRARSEPAVRAHRPAISGMAESFREYDGQVPFYEGSSRGKLVDPAGRAGGTVQVPTEYAEDC
ncbi:hypothetical protein BDP55DRAFT_732177 [Colletotrichum godetiae]|uniref:Uncharacterized protein n=1 Tax=Colletotrichum godetiae TaxID=1209918 RepID=A0AAJ0ADV9_9PEZI|nr:uncharacterized protein BDP55DRAFT_732177 [Colletotrichum godetiae]KAK1671495.1 hypothetical protein BDP55DRAFT_732177 [Colletotrichum godetiae]